MYLEYQVYIHTIMYNMYCIHIKISCTPYVSHQKAINKISRTLLIYEYTLLKYFSKFFSFLPTIHFPWSTFIFFFPFLTPCAYFSTFYFYFFPSYPLYSLLLPHLSPLLAIFNICNLVSRRCVLKTKLKFGKCLVLQLRNCGVGVGL